MRQNSDLYNCTTSSFSCVAVENTPGTWVGPDGRHLTLALKHTCRLRKYYKLWVKIQVHIKNQLPEYPEFYVEWVKSNRKKERRKKRKKKERKYVLIMAS